MTEIDKNNNTSVSTLYDTVTKKFDDIIKILNEIKDQAPAVEKREKTKKGCTRKTPTYYRSRQRKVQLYSVEEMEIKNTKTLSTKFVSSTLVVPASHKDGSIKGIDKNTGFNKLEEKFQVTESLLSEERSFNDLSLSEKVQVFIFPISESVLAC
jgi:glycerophosphoryl diester phosphodiesterase